LKGKLVETKTHKQSFVTIILSAVLFLIPLTSIANITRSFLTVKEMIEEFHDFSIKKGTFKVLKENPLHIQLSPRLLGSPQYPDSADEPEIIEAEVKEAIVYGVYQSFIHTPIQEITVTAIPQVFNINTKKTKYLKKYKKTLSISKQKALELVHKHLKVSSFSDLKTDKQVGELLVHDQWIDDFLSIYHDHSSGPGLNLFFEELSK
jgi:hypothetical protein